MIHKRIRERLASHVLFRPLALKESIAESKGGHPAADHRSHAGEALEWLLRAQDATDDGGFSRGYSLLHNPFFGGFGWQPSYPETTGYIIPTMFLAADYLHRPELRERAIRAADWEIEVALASGAVQAGVIGHGRAPAIFNTGQVLFGWIKCLQESDAARFALAIERAGDFLVETLDSDGLWRKANSPFADRRTTLYNARVAWGLAEAGKVLGSPRMTDAAHRNLRAVAGLQHKSGWFPGCCLNDPVRPLLHTIAYTVRGLIEGGRVLEDPALVRAGSLAATVLRDRVRSDGSMPGRFDRNWDGAASWSCLTGQAQMANVWLRLAEITGDSSWLEPVPTVLEFLKRTQNRNTSDPGLRGGIKGSWPLRGGYGRYEILNWATKFFLDALIRHEAAQRPNEFDVRTHFLA